MNVHQVLLAKMEVLAPTFMEDLTAHALVHLLEITALLMSMNVHQVLLAKMVVHVPIHMGDLTVPVRLHFLV